jgi:acetyl esterase/lipase
MSLIVRSLLQRQWRNTKKLDDARIATLRPTPGVAEDADMRYIGDGNRFHMVDVYYPEGTTGLLPTVIDIHGGGWMYGDKELNKYYCLYLASKGYAVVNMSYRLLPQTDIKGQVKDIFACLHWLSANAEKHHADLRRVCLTGDSAGGHLSGLTACIQLSDTLQKLYDVQAVDFGIDALCISHGVCDPANGVIGTKIVDDEYRRMMFGKRWKKEAIFTKVNFQDTADCVLAENKKFPRLFVISSEADELHLHTFALIDYLKEKDIPFTLKFWTKVQNANLGHVFHITHPSDYPESIETTAEMLKFFDAR